MSSLSLIIQREYLTRVRKKSFIILTLLMPFLMVALSLVPFWLSTLNDGSVKNVAVIDKTGIYAPLLESTDQFDFQIIGEADQQESETRLGKDLFAILQITNDLNKDPRAVSLTSEKQAPMELQSVIERTLNEKVTEQRLDELTQSSNVDSEAIGQVRSIIEDKSGITLRTLRMGDDGSVKESSTEIASIIGMVFTILIYMFILLYGNMVMQAVLEEKKSRVVEVMVSSVKPVNLLIGKIVGIGLVGLTQLAIWVIMTTVLFAGVSFFIANPEQAAAMSSGMDDFNTEAIMNSVMSINWLELIVYFVLYFIGGYILYASIFAMFASAVDSEEDTSQYLTPVTLLIMFAFFAGFYSVSNPDGPLAFWTSLIPFTSPIVMMVRIPFGIPFWEILSSLVLLYGTFILISIFAGKIYRVGILMYGKKPSFKEMMKWVTYK
ncbi:MAG: ABC transporter permease [Fermentimonas sp.]|nr:ABC transporter permease [Fermentimonas sp.]NLC86709.1 ABC transporter permease [Bacteroidales bacterium]HBT86035.1 ABC transporter permease [Porphyromonadaceae bacterium]MDD2931000.1 ABC transporter permease [Fermentimonas sp.]MDD3188290.1 ABC transporter permease [Fermentimonas sp.]